MNEQPAGDYSTWLSGLKVGDPVMIHHALGLRQGKIRAIEETRLWIEWVNAGGAEFLSLVNRATGESKNAKTYIKPDRDGVFLSREAKTYITPGDDILPAIGPIQPDGKKLVGWETV
jgi:hypothetical protein